MNKYVSVFLLASINVKRCYNNNSDKVVPGLSTRGSNFSVGGVTGVMGVTSYRSYSQSLHLALGL